MLVVFVVFVFCFCCCCSFARLLRVVVLLCLDFCCCLMSFIYLLLFEVASVLFSLSKSVIQQSHRLFSPPNISCLQTHASSNYTDPWPVFCFLHQACQRRRVCTQELTGQRSSASQTVRRGQLLSMNCAFAKSQA